MRKTPLAILAMAAAAALMPLSAQAGGNVSVAVSTPDFGFRIGAPIFGPRVVPVMVPAPVMVHAPVVMPAPVFYPPPRFIHAPVVVAPVVVPRHRWSRPVVVAPRVIHAPVGVHPRHVWTPPPRFVPLPYRGHGHGHGNGHARRHAAPQHVAYGH